MKNRSWGVAAATMVVLAAGAVAQAEESLRTEQGVACAPEGGPCARFQGYVYVRRGAAAPAVRTWGGAAAPGFGERRLYLHMGAAEAR